MAILTGINTRLKGSAGDWTFAQCNGQTVAKQKVAKKSTPVRTLKQMIRRVQWNNIVNMYRAFNGNLHPSFENKDSKMSDFNAFVSANIGIVPVYLNKEEAREGGCVAAPYQITRGSLPSIEVGGESVKVTNIALGDGSITDATTVADFARMVIDNNEGFLNGDQLTAFIALQKVNGLTLVPYVVVKAQNVELDLTDNVTTLRSLVDADAFSAVEGFLGASAAVNGGIAWVHSRSTASGTKVSTQRFEVTNALLELYQSTNKRDAAIESYGGINKQEYLTPGNSGGDAPEPGPVTHTLTLTCSESGGCSFTVDGEAYTGPVTLDEGAEVTVVATPASGYNWVKWSDNETAKTRTLTLDDDISLQAIVEEA